MSRGEAERETIRISADAASKLLVSLRKQRDKLNGRIGKLEAVVDAWEAISGKKMADADSSNADVRVRVKKGQVPFHIEEILKGGQEYDEPELRKAIEDKFRVSYTRATVYTSLRRGLKAHRFVQNGKKWSMNPLKTLQTA
jgi:hypothetical protein